MLLSAGEARREIRILFSFASLSRIENISITSVAKAMKVLRKLGCCLQIEVGIV